MALLSTDELNLICLYDPGNREGTIFELRDMMSFLTPEETDLKTLAEGVITKLEAMTDEEYDELSEELTPPYSFDDDDDSPYEMPSPAFFDDYDDLFDEPM